MGNLGTKAWTLLGGLVLSTHAMADGITHAQYVSAESGIDAAYRVARGSCEAMAGNAREICVAMANGNETVARAELEARREPTARNIQDVRSGKAAAVFSVAMERCGGKSGRDEETCKREARAARVHALSSAEARAETSRAEYVVAKERCNALARAAKDPCIDKAKISFVRQ
jgi:hypothetical protein